MPIRNLLTVLGIAAIVGIAFLIIKPDWIRQIASSPTPSNPGVMTKVSVRLSADRLRQPDLPRDAAGFLYVDGGSDVARKIVDEVGDDLPSRNFPYLLVINKSTNAMRYCRLGAGVRKVSLKLAYPDVKIREVPTTPGGPYQAIIWVPQAMDLQLEIDVALNPPARS